MTVNDGAPLATAESAASAVAVIRRILVAVKRFWFDREALQWPSGWWRAL